MQLRQPTIGQNSAARSRLLVLLFTDVVGSTEFKDTLTTAIYLPLLQRHDVLLREAVASARGEVQQDTGDGCFAFFPTSSDAVRAALMFQRNMNAEPWPPGQRLTSRTGIHVGEVAETEIHQERGGKLVGLAADLAARVMGLAQGGQILLTRSAFDDARQFIAAHPGDEHLLLKWVAHGPYLFKGSEEPFDVFEVGVEGQSPLAAPPDSEKARRAIRAGDEQTLGWRPAMGLAMPGSPHWIIEKKVGEGGFGEVWLARHVKAKSVRVFKFCFDAERLRALKREVVLFRLLKEAVGDRRDIAAVKDWRFEEAPYFIEMDYTPEGNLADWAEQQGGIDKVPLSQRLGIISGIARALAAAHSVGILHKDIKPSNVLMVRDAEGQFFPRLTDFGIGILTDKGRLQDFNITAAGFTVSNITINDSSRTGTRMYAPPESLAAKPHTVQGDVYALGVMLYQLVIGDLNRPLGVGWERLVTDDLLREDIAVCVDVDPARRAASAAEVANRIDNLEKRRTNRQRQLEQVEALRLARRRRAQVRALGSVLVVLAVVLVAFAGLWREAARQRADAESQRAAADAQRAVATQQRAEALRQKQIADANAGRALASERQARQDLSESLVAQGDALALTGDWLNCKRRYESAARIRAELGQAPSQADLAMLNAYLHSPPPICAMTQPTGIAEHDPMVLAYYAAAGRSPSQSVGHLESITSIACSPDGRFALTGVRHAPLTYWDMVTGRRIFTLDGHHAGERVGALSPDGKWALSGGNEGTLTLWNLQTGDAARAVHLAHFGKVTAVAFSPDGTKAMSGGGLKKYSINLWDLDSFTLLKTLSSSEAEVVSLVISTDGRKAISGHAYLPSKLWDVESGNPLQTLGGTPPPCLAAFGTDDQAMVAKVQVDRFGASRLHIGDQPITHFPLKLTPQPRISVDGRLMIRQTSDRVVGIWDFAADREARCLTDHDEPLGINTVITPDGRFAMTGGDDTTLRAWNLSATPQVREHRIDGIVGKKSIVSPDGRMVLCAGTVPGVIEDGGAHGGLNGFQLWDIATGLTLQTQKLPFEIHDAAWSPDQRTIALACADGNVRIWNVASGAVTMTVHAHEAAANTVAFSPDGSLLATGGNDQLVKLWRAGSGEPVKSLSKHEGHVWHVMFTGDGTKLISGDMAKSGVLRDTHLVIWNVQTGAPGTQLMSRDVRSVTLSPRGDLAVVSERAGGISLFDLATGKKIHDLSDSQSQTGYSGFSTACFSPDGALIALANATGTVLSDVTGDHHLGTLRHDGQTLDGVAFVSGANRLVVGQTVYDLSWPAQYRQLKPLVEHARLVLQDHPDDANALKVVGEWYAFNATWDWAAQLLERARTGGAIVSSLLLGRCYWQFDKPEFASREFQAAKKQRQAPSDYLDLCIRATNY